MVDWILLLYSGSISLPCRVIKPREFDMTRRICVWIVPSSGPEAESGPQFRDGDMVILKCRHDFALADNDLSSSSS